MTTQPKNSPRFTYKAALSHRCVDCGQGIQVGDEIAWKYTGRDKFKVEEYRPVHLECSSQKTNVTV